MRLFRLYGQKRMRPESPRQITPNSRVYSWSSAKSSRGFTFTDATVIARRMASQNRRTCPLVRVGNVIVLVSNITSIRQSDGACFSSMILTSTSQSKESDSRERASSLIV